MIPYLIYERLNDIVYINASISVTPPAALQTLEECILFWLVYITCL